MNKIGNRTGALRKNDRLLIPPYGREIVAARKRGEGPNVHIMVGSRAWVRAKRRSPGERLALPLDFDHVPTDFDFTVLGGLSVIVNAIDADIVLARQVAVAIVEHGARLVVLLHPALPKNSEFIYGEST